MHHWIKERPVRSDLNKIDDNFDLKSVQFDPNKYRISLKFPKMKVTYQALEAHDYNSMEILIDRLNKEHPGLVLLPLCSQITTKDPPSGSSFSPIFLETQKDLD